MTRPRERHGYYSPIALADRFWPKVRKTSGCWEWTACRTKSGYGIIGAGGRHAYAHRVAYELCVGPIPEGLTLDHLCRNRGCVNPAHLEPVTMRENLRRGDSPVGREARQTHCLRGHPLSGPNLRTDRRGHRYCRACCAIHERAHPRSARRDTRRVVRAAERAARERARRRT